MINVFWVCERLPVTSVLKFQNSKQNMRSFFARPTLKDSPLKVKQEGSDHAPPPMAAAGDRPTSETSAPCGTVDPEVPATQPDEESDVLDQEASFLLFFLDGI